MMFEYLKFSALKNQTVCNIINGTTKSIKNYKYNQILIPIEYL